MFLLPHATPQLSCRPLQDGGRGLASIAGISIRGSMTVAKAWPVLRTKTATAMVVVLE